jgi:hypothetical protein
MLDTLELLCNCCVRVVQIAYLIKKWDLIPTQHHHNNCTTPPHMGVGPTHWAPPTCEGMLCSCCGGVVNLSFSLKNHGRSTWF